MFHGLAARFPPPANLAIGLAAFQVFFIPTGVMYWLASRSAPADIEEVRETLRARASTATGQSGQPVSPATENDRSRWTASAVMPTANTAAITQETPTDT